MKMTVRDIVKEYIITHGGDGLCDTDCGCGIDDLFPCDSNPAECIVAKKIKVTQEMIDKKDLLYEVGDDYFEPIEIEEVKK